MKKNILHLIRVSLSYKGGLILAVMLGFLTIGSSIGLIMTSAYLIARAALQPSIAELHVAIVGVRFFGVSRGVFRYLERLVSHNITFKLLSKFRVLFYKRLEPLAPARLLKYRSGDMLSRIVSDIESLEYIFARLLVPPCVALFVSLLIWALFGFFDIKVAVAVSAGFYFSGIGIPLLAMRLSKKPGAEIVRLRSQLNVMMVDGIQGMAELIIFNRAKSHADNINKLQKKIVAYKRKMDMIAGLHESLMILFMNITVFAVVFFAAPQVTAGVINGVILAALALGVMAAFEALLPVSDSFQYLKHSSAAAERVFNIVNLPCPVRDPEKSPAEKNNCSISFENVNFSYSESSGNRTLENVSFKLTQGKSVAIVGPSGSGKSTIINLLLRFWDNYDGEIFFGGSDLRKFRQEDIPKFISVLPQNIHLFNGTIRDNLVMAKPNASESEIHKCVKIACADDFIEQLPQKYETMIGEQGLQLSGGERRRLALARTLIQNCPVIILDEPTADLDPVTESKLLESIFSISRKRALLIITHRLVKLENVDEILVMRNGKIAQRGNHKEMLKGNNLYSKQY